MGLPRPHDWSALGRGADPVPGNPVRVSALATQLSESGSDINRAVIRLGILFSEAEGTSEYLDALREQAEIVEDRLRRVRERFTGAAAALSDYAPLLDAAQDDADRALRVASTARDDAQNAQYRIRYYEDLLRDPDLTSVQHTRYSNLLLDANNDLQDAQRRTGDAELMLQQAINDRNTAGDAAADRMREVEEAGDLNDSGWDNFVQWWEENGELVDLLITIVSIVAAIVTVVLIATGVGAIVIAIIAAAVMVVTIANAVMQVLAGTKSIAEGILEIALCFIPMGGGHILRGAVGTVRGVAVTSRMASLGARGVTGYTRSSVTSWITESAQGATNWFTRTFAGEYAEISAMSSLRMMAGNAASPTVRAAAESQAWHFIPPEVPGVIDGLFSFTNDGQSLSSEILESVIPEEAFSATFENPWSNQW